VGRARFRGIRLIHTHLNGELLSKEDLADLAHLQLDLVACLTERPGEPGPVIQAAYLVPGNKTGKVWDFIGPVPVSELSINFVDYIGELENEFVRERGKHFSLADNNDKCFIVALAQSGRHDTTDERMAEMKDLCHSAGITVVDVIVQRVKELHPQYLIGKGKIEETVIRAQQAGVDLLVFDREVSPGQIKNISLMTELKVIDRNQLILDIFAAQAQTKEAKIQVELAQLRYVLPRLTRKTTAFSRLMGGIGGRGPGETKLEVDRRRIRDRISLLDNKLEEITKIRDKKREKRRGSGLPVVSIVGYTNSGKSTLLNLLTKSSVETEDRPFSTLNPTTRTIKYPERKKIILTDTVGFIADLPEVLVRAFMATLEELEDAHLLLHLVDISSPDFETRIETVDTLLTHLSLTQKKRLLVFNKIDRVDREFLSDAERHFGARSISCVKKEGIEELIEWLEYHLSLDPSLFSSTNE